MSEKNPQRMAGWMLGIWFLIHALLFPGPGAFSTAIVAVLVAGMILRLPRVSAPAWLGWVFLGLVFLMPFWTETADLPALLASGSAAALLLGRLTPPRGLWVILCAIALLASLTLDPASEIPLLVIVLDAALLMLFAEQVHAPEEARRGLREILGDSLRLVVPVGIVVTGAFWFFPALSSRTNAVLTGFTDRLDPGEFSELRSSERTAFIAAFPENVPVPEAGDLYWRGQVLEKNDGLRWSREQAAIRPSGQTAPRPGWGYSLQAMPGRPAVPLDVTSSDAPRVAGGDLDVPEKIAKDRRMLELKNRVLPAGRSVQENLESLARFLGSSGFVYSMRPGRMPSEDLAGFFYERRKGFCEHYAAASANLLRMAGTPARVVTGFRGGRWNPWLRTITVRDSDAHAWVEAWDPSAQRWIRFDPTSFVAPELTREIEMERDPGQWSWLRFTSAFIESVWKIYAGLLIRAALAAAALLMAMAAVRALLRGRSRTDPVQSALVRVEKFASRRNLGRAPGETPLAWLLRLQSASGMDGQKLRQFAAAYEQGVYSRNGLDGETRARLREAANGFRPTVGPEARPYRL